MSRALVSLLFAAAAFAVAPGASAAPASNAAGQTAVFAVHVGINLAPSKSGLAALRFADDDAARMFELTSMTAERSVLLTTLDAESQRRYPNLPAEARPPSLRELRGALRRLKPEMEEARRGGRKVVLLFSYAGHGTLEGKTAQLTMLDGHIDRDFIEKHIARLPADATHLVLDACHAGGVVTQRGFKQSSASGRRMARAEADRALGLDLFQRHPHMGALIATSPDGVAHEWSALEAGVFTYELVSALSGAADINGDGRVAYSEVGAFVAAANRAIADPRGRVGLVVEPPRQNQREPLFDRRWVGDGAYLLGDAAVGRLRIERDDGLRLLDIHPGGEGPFALLVPTGRRLHVSAPDGPSGFDADYSKASITLGSGERIWIGSLGFRRGARVAKRGGLESALREGFFRKPYDRSYYEGYVDSRRMVAEAFGDAPDGLSRDDDPAFVGGAAQDELPEEQFFDTDERRPRDYNLDHVGVEQPFQSEGPRPYAAEMNEAWEKHDDGEAYFSDPEGAGAREDSRREQRLANRAEGTPRQLEDDREFSDDYDDDDRPAKAERRGVRVAKAPRGATASVSAGRGRTEAIEDVRVKEGDGRGLLAWGSIGLLSAGAVGIGAITVYSGVSTGVAGVEWATTRYQVPALQAQVRAWIFGAITAAGVLTVVGLLAGVGTIWIFTAPDEE